MFEAVYVINLAYAALLSSTFTRTLARLRTALIIGAVCFVIYGLLEGIRSMVIWNVIIGSLHATRLVRDIRTQRSVSLSIDEMSIRDNFFPELSDFEFHVLWSMGTDEVYTDGERLIERGSEPDSVSLVLNGAVDVHRPDGAVWRLGTGFLYGEMSFVSGNAASADVIAADAAKVHRWNQRQLATLDQVQPACARAIRGLITRDLALKVR